MALLFRSLVSNAVAFDYSVLDTIPEYRFGWTLNAGEYPNEVKRFKSLLPELRQLFTFRERFSRHAESALRNAANRHFQRWKKTEKGTSRCCC